MNRRFSLAASLFVLTGIGVAPHPASAVPTVDLSWNACSPVVPSLPRGAPGPISMFVSVVGQEEGHTAYQMYLFVRRPAGGAFPDAWRFDPTGCQGSSFIEMRHLPPTAMAKSCPAFQGGGNSLQIKNYNYLPSTGRAQLVVANSYPSGVSAPDPATRYFLLGVVFDHTYSVAGAGDPGVTCGGFEHDMMVSFDSGCVSGCFPRPPSWLDLQGNERDFAVGQGTLTFCGSCVPVPAIAKTWGSIKGRYRR